MHFLIRNAVAVVAGILAGSVVNMGIIESGPSLFPLPDGVDMSDMDRFAENLKLFQPVNFIAPWIAHALGTLVGAAVTAKLAASHQAGFALGISVFFLLGGIMMAVLYGGPGWFVTLDLLLAYIPMGVLAGALVVRQSIEPA